MLIQGIVCPLCKCTLYSRARHDFRQCSCKAIAIDGGLDYRRMTWNPNLVNPSDIQGVALNIDVTKEQLYHDWNEGLDLYGLIPEGE